MNDRLLLLWYKLRIPIIVVLVLAVGSLGAWVGTVDWGRGPDAPETVETAVAETSVLLKGDGALLACLRGGTADCSDKGTVHASLVSSVGETRVLAESGWLNKDGATALSWRDSVEDLAGFSGGARGDLDNDGYAEIVLQDGTGNFLILSEDATGSLYNTASLRLPELVGGPGKVVLADWNQDGWLDIMFVRETVPTAGLVRGLELFYNLGRRNPGVFARPANLGRIASLETSILLSQGGAGSGIATFVDAIAGDMDGDRNVDLVLVTKTGILTVLWGDGTLFAEQASTLPAPAGVVGMTIDDIDRNGILDVLLAYDVESASSGRACPFNRPCEPYPDMGTGGVAVITNPGERDLTPRPSLSINNVTGVSSIAAGDIDGDGWTEIVLGRESLSGGEEDYTSDGTLAYKLVLDTNGFVATGIESWDSFDFSGIAAARVSLADIDTDGDLDLLFASRDERGLHWWENKVDANSGIVLTLVGRGVLQGGGSPHAAPGALVTYTLAGNTYSYLTVAENTVRIPTGGLAVTGLEVTFPLTDRSVNVGGVEAGSTLEILEPVK